MDAPSGGSGVTNSRNSVEIFITSLEKAYRSTRVYNYASGQGTLENILDNTLNAMDRCFVENEQLDIDVKPYEMHFEKKVVYNNTDRKTSLAYALYSDGIRLLVFKQGLKKEELKELFKVLSTDFSKPENIDEDLYCLFVEKSLPHFQVISGDPLSEAFEKEPTLREEMTKFLASVREKTCEIPEAQTRRLRSEDLRILEEFRLNPAQFARTDEEVGKVIRTLGVGREGHKKERETLERLLLMGFHFLVSAHDSAAQIQIGRDLVTRVSLVVLGSGFFDLFKAVVAKITELQKDRLDKAGEYQKIVDSLFHVDHLELYANYLKQPTLEVAITQVLQMGPPSAVRLMILLVGLHPPLGRPLSEIIYKQIPNHINWILDECQKDPANPAWEQLINLMSARPTHHFQKILEQLLKSATPTVKLKILRQLASIGTPEALRAFENIFAGPQASERIQAYGILSGAPNKNSLKVIKAHIESDKFQGVDLEEREHGFAALARMGGELSLPWFEHLWNLPTSGLFKKKAEIERRSLVLKSLLRGHTGAAQKFLEKIPADHLKEELESLAARIRSAKVDKGGASS